MNIKQMLQMQAKNVPEEILVLAGNNMEFEYGKKIIAGERAVEQTMQFLLDVCVGSWEM